MSEDESGHTRFPGPLPRPRPELPEPPAVDGFEDDTASLRLDLPAEPHDTPDRDGLRIGLWGSQESGKTTFLGALRLAMFNTASTYGRWQVIASDDASERFMVETSRLLSVERKFPEATQSAVEFSWRFLGDLAGSPYAQRRRLFARPRPGADEMQFLLTMLDVGGGTYEDLNEDLEARRSTDHLAASAGLVYLFDPIREASEGKSFAYLNGTLARLTRKALKDGRLEGPYLPQHISVCLTKFDDPEVFERARRGGWTDEGPHGTPVVPDPEGFFDWLAKDLHGGTMQQVGEALRASFHPSRIRFFATSSIGFGTSPAGGVDLGRFGNVDESDGTQQIIGPVRPHNVMEPVISLLVGLRKQGRA